MTSAAFATTSASAAEAAVVAEPVLAEVETAPAPCGIRDHSPAPWRVGVMSSIALHSLVALVVLFGLVRLPPPSRVADAAMTVEIAPAPAAPPAPPRQTPPGPQQVRAITRPVPQNQSKISPPRVDTPVKPEVVMQAKPQPQPDRPVLPKAADQTTDRQAAVAPPKAENAAPSAGASTVMSNAAQTWENLLLAKLQRNKRYPDSAQARGQEDVVYVKMSIDRAGRLTGADVVRSRGFAMLDSEVLSLVHRSSPYAPPPASEQGDMVVVVVPVEFFLKHNR
jgi:protein TonB